MMRFLIQFIWLTSVMVVVTLSLLPADMPSPDEFGIDKIEHFAAYLWLSTLPFSGLKKQSNAFIIILFVFLLGGALELFQAQIIGRTASFWDMIANSIGIFAGTLLGIHCRRHYLKHINLPR